MNSTISQCVFSLSSDALLLETISKQMEFYFGNANLNKDRYLSKLVQSDRHGKGWIPLHIFLRFNKIKSLTTDLQTIARAIETSTKLELSESRRHVRRIDPIPSKSDADNRTIYVERLPDEVSHESVRTLFSVYGEVLYTSVPRFSVTRIAKGFAFVEFESSEHAEAAIRDFDAHGAMGKSGIRVMSKQLWLMYKEEYKKLLKVARQMGHEIEEKEEEEYIRGVLLRVGNIPKDTPRKSIRDLFQSLASVAYVDMSGDGVSSIVRMHQPEGADSVLERHKHEPLLLMETPLDVSLITGADEKQYWSNVRQLQEAKKEAKKDKKKTPAQSETANHHAQESSSIQNAAPSNPKDTTAQSKGKRKERDAKSTPKQNEPKQKTETKQNEPKQKELKKAEPMQKLAQPPPTKKPKKNTHIRFSDSEEECEDVASEFILQPSISDTMTRDGKDAAEHNIESTEAVDAMQEEKQSNSDSESSKSSSEKALLE
eukprot:TRINITY_DN2137_c0_g1_i6.p1 TRINITY_DN2137_c0_g1~~TRINITY_DN2137_c0_g1_i6.p1  ORF type:complete len:485 (-),score=135.04 TRINITY_DN2137_c0_g1_i6:290-1744(-)